MTTKRNGTVDLFAALNVGTGEVLYQTRKRHTANDALAFFKWIDLHVRHLDVPVVWTTSPPTAHHRSQSGSPIRSANVGTFLSRRPVPRG
ncbi:MAG: hypothetical protein ABIQ73_24370 [Acidimicrobiales bacterium]